MRLDFDSLKITKKKKGLKKGYFARVNPGQNVVNHINL